ncbi:hypothetical protein E2C01_035834 [Portunus trituberculatus]|uniref:Uncharacterized protein n=1 Tax=Portunus trituberculatus TaxID=210409 RepID=A0A5B7FAS9_PORTR|nr:hypothetical protein [Portunus trituberculatus]
MPSLSHLPTPATAGPSSISSFFKPLKRADPATADPSTSVLPTVQTKTSYPCLPTEMKMICLYVIWPNCIFKLSARRNFKLRAREFRSWPIGGSSGAGSKK